MSTSETGPKDSNGDVIGNPESGEVLLGFAQTHVLADEDERQRHLDNKAGTLAGFVAVALSLEAGLGASVLLGDEIECGARAVFTLFFAVAVGALAASALCAVLGVLVPQDYLGLDEPTIDELREEPMLKTDPAELRERLLTTLVDITLAGRKRNDRKAKALKVAAILLAVGVGAIAGQGLVLPFA